MRRLIAERRVVIGVAAEDMQISTMTIQSKALGDGVLTTRKYDHSIDTPVGKRR